MGTLGPNTTMSAHWPFGAVWKEVLDSYVPSEGEEVAEGHGLLQKKSFTPTSSSQIAESVLRYYIPYL